MKIGQTTSPEASDGSNELFSSTEAATSFCSPDSVASLSDKDVHVWSFGLDCSPAELTNLKSILYEEERDRADRFRFDTHRHRFIKGRGMSRFILSHYLDLAPDKIEFKYGAHGKPGLAEPHADLAFNLSHSEDLAFLAITRAGPIGVDVESIRTLDDFDALVSRFFSPAENEVFEKLPVEQKPTAFFNLWTRKEAWLKATGLGISQHLTRVEVSFLPVSPARFVSVPAESQGDWFLYQLNSPPGFTAALATGFEPARITVCQCDNANWEESDRRNLRPLLMENEKNIKPVA